MDLVLRRGRGPNVSPRPQGRTANNTMLLATDVCPQTTKEDKEN